MAQQQPPPLPLPSRPDKEAFVQSLPVCSPEIALAHKRFVDEPLAPGTFGAPEAALSSFPTAQIASLQFGVLKPTDILRLSHVQVVNRNLYDATKREPTEYGCLDRRLGVSDKKTKCTSCGKELTDCIGHFGHVSLELPVYHIGYFKEILKVLQSICKRCSRVMLTPDQADPFLKKITNPTIDRRYKAVIAKKVQELARKRRRCPHCGAHNGKVKKMAGSYRIVHELKHKDAAQQREDYLAEFEEASMQNKTLKENLNKLHEDLNPLDVLTLFKKIPDGDCDLLNLSRAHARPEDLLVTQFPVPPVCIRPSVAMGPSGTNEDDLTIKLADILYINQFGIKRAFEQGGPTSSITEAWDFLQTQVAMFVNSDMPGFNKQLTPQTIKPIRALTQRLKGKSGRFRGNLSGKRVDFSSRTVISPDPNLRVDQVGVPRRMAKILTYPERAQPHNIEKLRRAIRNGPHVHPGANFVEFSNGSKIYLKFGNRELLADKLQYGDIVERHLEDEDVVLFNRQPSLHKMSIMCHRAKILGYKTLRFNECVCTPYNADFDGDEMNLHLPQTEEARSEALLLMGVQENLVTPRHGEPLVAAIQDFLTTGYLITQKDVFYTRSQFCAIVSYMDSATERVEIPVPTILKPMQLWTGKQIINAMLRPNSDEQWPLINLELKARNYEGGEHMCPRDGWVCIRNSELMCGNLCKASLGGSRSGLFYCLIRDHSQYVAANVMNRLSRLSARWIGTQGFSIGIDDVTPSDRLLAQKRSLLTSGYTLCKSSIKQFKDGQMAVLPGFDEEQTLESKCLGVLSQIREDAGSHCLKELDYIHNSPLIMAICGSKGSKINISQMVACVGQQAVSGHRIPNGFINRSLPHFPKFSREPDAKGFVENSFYTGLTATEFFFHTMGGREGLVDTAVKTAETGYMQRRLMKALEDLCVAYDGSVRTSEKCVVQFTYGDDGLDPVMMVNGMLPVDYGRVLEHIRHTVPAGDEGVMLVPQFREAIKIIDGRTFEDCSAKFRDSLKTFLNKKLDELIAVCTELNLMPSEYKHNDKCRVSRTDAEHILHQTIGLTPGQFHHFCQLCKQKYHRAGIEPGTAVGAIAAQSIGEPGTQMTLKTFHFAGVASMNITLGVPRIKEIINASKKINSPIITAPLVTPNDLKAARIVKGRLEKTTLGDIAEYIEEMYTPQQCYLSVKLDLRAIEALQLGLTNEDICRALINCKKLKLKTGVRCKGIDRLRIYPPDTRKAFMMYSMQALKAQLPSVMVSGIPSIGRAVINDKGGGQYNLLVEGYNLRQVMGTQGIKGTETTSNHVIDVNRELGIEAARVTIMREIHTTMESHGLSIDPRHVSLLADIMSFRGEILGITRHGVAKMKESVLMLASFEKTADHLFEAAVRGSSDEIAGVSECIIMGVPIPIGTGLFKLMQNTSTSAPIQPRRPLLCPPSEFRYELMTDAKQ